jgi:hypothetical protein
MVEFERERERESVSEIYDIVIMTSRVLKIGPAGRTGNRRVLLSGWIG